MHVMGRLLKCTWAKNYQNTWRFDKAIAKMKRCIFASYGINNITEQIIRQRKLSATVTLTLV